MRNIVKQSGFTLIELIIVIVILGILAVVAIPKYINISQDANQAATNGVAASLASANVINYAARSENNTLGNPVANCQNVATALQGGALPAGYTITSAAVAVNVNATCTLTGSGSPATTATFVATGIS